MVKRWTDIAAELEAKLRDRPRAQERAETPTGRIVETSEAWGMPDEIEEVEVRSGSMQAFKFREDAEPRSHTLVVELDTEMAWDLMEKLVRHLGMRLPGPLVLNMAGQMEDITDEQ
jgi:hypothetical protein